MSNRLILPFLFLILPAGAAPFIVAHRGASNFAPENTIPAFEEAWKQGADAIEGDFYLTSDGHIVCFHDANTRNITGESLAVTKSTLKQLQALDAGKHFGRKFARTRIPTLAEVLATVPEGKKIFIEIKDGPRIIQPLLTALEKAAFKPEQFAIICFNAGVIKTIKAERPEYSVNWLCKLKKKRGKLSPSVEEIKFTLEQCSADGLGISGRAYVDAQLVHSIQKAGYSVHVWTIDKAGSARRYRALGVDSITTNAPQKIRDALKK
jgi:glycerophosphoryl diester phosphodiesterase